MNRALFTLVACLVAPPLAGSAALERAIQSCDLRAATEALANQDAASTVERRWNRARVDLLRGETSRAVDDLEWVVAQNPRSSEYHLWYSRALFAQASEGFAVRRPFVARRAIAELKKAEALGNDEASIDLMLIHIRVPLLGDGRDGAEEIAKALTTRRSSVAPLARGIMAYEREEWQIAERELKIAADTLSDPRRALFWLGFLYQKLQRWNNAFKSHERLLALSPNDPRVWYEFARTSDFSGLGTDMGKKMLRRYLSAELPSGAPTKKEARKLLGRLDER